MAMSTFVLLIRNMYPLTGKNITERLLRIRITKRIKPDKALAFRPTEAVLFPVFDLPANLSEQLDQCVKALRLFCECFIYGKLQLFAL